MVDLNERYAHYRNRLRAYVDARKLTNDVIGERIGAHPVTVSKLRSGATKLDDEWRARMAAGLGVEHDVLFGEGPLPQPEPREIHKPLRKRGRKPAAPPVNDNRLPLYGLAAGSLAGVHTMSSDPVDSVPCPPALADVIGAYALKTRGESMIPRYFPGDVLYVNPHQRPHSGDHVIIQTQNYDGGGTETWVKRFDAEDKDMLHASQYNPSARVSFRKQLVIHVHRVLPINELFGTT